MHMCKHVYVCVHIYIYNNRQNRRLRLQKSVDNGASLLQGFKRLHMNTRPGSPAGFELATRLPYILQGAN